MTNQGFPRVKSMPDKISFLRKSESMSVVDLAQELRLPTSRIEGLETGLWQLDLEDVIRYCDYFALAFEPFLFDNFSDFKRAVIADNEKMMRAIGYSV